MSKNKSAAPAKRPSGSRHKHDAGKRNIQIWLTPDEMAAIDEAVASLDDRSRTWLVKNAAMEMARKIILEKNGK